MTRYKIILVDFPETSLNDTVVDYVGWEDISLTIPETLIRHNISRINWTSVSSRKDLSNEFIQEFNEHIDWGAFLMSEKLKDVNFLVQNRNKVEENVHVMNDEKVKKMYYINPEFIDAFSEYIDWVWYARNVKIPEYLLDRYWTMFNQSVISASQNITPVLYEKYWETLDWNKISRYQKLNKTMINRWKRLLHWKEIFLYQTLPCELLELYKFNCKDSNIIIPSHQNLSEQFIEENLRWLDIPTVCEKQNMSFEFLKKHKKKWDVCSLEKNIFFNNSKTVQILKKPKTQIYYVLTPLDENVHSYFTIP